MIFVILKSAFPVIFVAESCTYDMIDSDCIIRILNWSQLSRAICTMLRVYSVSVLGLLVEDPKVVESKKKGAPKFKNCRSRDGGYAVQPLTLYS